MHGITVFGGTFPAEIWHSLYSDGGVPCEEFSEPEQPISWSPYYGQFTQALPTNGDSDTGSGQGGDEPPPPGSAAVGGYDPDATTRAPTPPAPGRRLLRRRLPRRLSGAAKGAGE